ncbi:MAG: thioredoxin domain-containing protein [Schumannella sp.]|nr:thioredoxin domain-containing protein [Microbacteriaceae bacterium]
MPEERLTKNQKREAAREAARAAREKQKRRERLLKWLVPTVSTLVVLALGAGITWVIVANQPGPQSAEGPRNMISDGILFTAQDGDIAPVTTPAIQPSAEPVPTDIEDDGLAHIVTYVDFSCPACKSFEETYAEIFQSLVAGGQATLEVHPIAILDNAYAGSRYSSRANNVGACVADLAPESFLDVMAAMYAGQPEEGTTGLTDAAIIDLVHGAGLVDDEVDTCIDDEFYAPWVAAATRRATSDASLVVPGNAGLSTPTVVVNGQLWDRSTDVLSFIQSQMSAPTEG